ncbi:MAG TPA: sigma-70 family RNA polymerase sigma factor [Planctomycetota bacterium]|nr:sigma-70 family RNA polymerase sigma factor [Planctomycetota bacterium]
MAEAQRHAADWQLVQDVLAGRQDALDRFLARMRCVPRFLAGSNAWLGRPLDPHDLQDLSQDAITAIWKKLPTFTGASTLETWVFGFCAHEVLKGAHRRRRRPSLATDWGGDAFPERAEPPAPLEDESALARVLRALEGTSPDEADVVRAKHFDGLTFEEIAARLGISPNTAKTRYYRGVARLRRLLRPRLAEESS